MRLQHSLIALCLLTGLHLQAQFPMDIKWYRIEGVQEANLFAPGDHARTAVRIEAGTGTTATWVVVDPAERVVASSPAPVPLSATEDTLVTVDAGVLQEGFYVGRIKIAGSPKPLAPAIVPFGVWGPIAPPDETVSEPFFPFGVYDKYTIHRNDPVIQKTYLHAICRLMRANGLNIITSGNTLFPPTMDKLDICQQYGIKVMIRLGSSTDEAQLNHSTVLTLMYGDEPTAENIEQYKQTYDEIQAKYPTKTLVTCMVGDGIGSGAKTDPLQLWPKLDARLRMVRFYPIRHINYGPTRTRLFARVLPVSATFRLIDQATDSPWWFVDQTFGSNRTELRPLPFYRNPEPAELRALTHLGLAHGASGVVSYSLQVHMGNEANPGYALVTQDTLAPCDGKLAAMRDIAFWLARVKRTLLATRFGGIDAGAMNPLIEVVPRSSEDGRKFVYIINRDADHAIATELYVLGIQVDSIRDVATGAAVALGNSPSAHYSVAPIRLEPGEGAFYEVIEAKGPQPAGAVDVTAMLTYSSPTLTPVGEESTICRVIQPMPLWWRFQEDREDAGMAAGWGAAGFDDSQWGYLKTAIFWDRQGITLSGIGWYRTTIAWNPQTAAGKPVRLFFQGVDESAWVYLNGEQVCVHYPDTTEGWDQSFTIDVTDKLKAGVNSVAVRVLNRTAAGGIYGTVALVTPTEQTKQDFYQLWP